MSPRPLLRTVAGTAVILLGVAGCAGPGSAAAASSAPANPVAEQLTAQLDALPSVDGATTTTPQATDRQLVRTYTVPAGTPACLQILARLDAGGYRVVAGAASDPVAPDSCLTTTPTDPVTPDRGTATVLAAGGSSVALSWTATTYTLAVTP